jgi:hypothetical protein
LSHTRSLSATANSPVAQLAQVYRWLFIVMVLFTLTCFFFLGASAGMTELFLSCSSCSTTGACQGLSEEIEDREKISIVLQTTYANDQERATCFRLAKEASGSVPMSAQSHNTASRKLSHRHRHRRRRQSRLAATVKRTPAAAPVPTRRSDASLVCTFPLSLIAPLFFDFVFF